LELEKSWQPPFNARINWDFNYSSPSHQVSSLSPVFMKFQIPTISSLISEYSHIFPITVNFENQFAFGLWYGSSGCFLLASTINSRSGFVGWLSGFFGCSLTHGFVITRSVICELWNGNSGCLLCSRMDPSWSDLKHILHRHEEIFEGNSVVL